MIFDIFTQETFFPMLNNPFNFKSSEQSSMILQDIKVMQDPWSLQISCPLKWRETASKYNLQSSPRKTSTFWIATHSRAVGFTIHPFYVLVEDLMEA